MIGITLFAFIYVVMRMTWGLNILLSQTDSVSFPDVGST